MNTHKFATTVIVNVAAILIGCGDQESHQSTEVGKLTLPIVSNSSSGRTFVLCQGQLGIQRVDSSGTWSIDAAAHAAEQSVTQALPSGSYRLSLTSWQLCEATGAGVLPIDALLTGGSQIDFQIYPRQATYVSFTFMVQDLKVAFDGNLVVSINVSEGNLAGAAGAGGSISTGGYSGGGYAGSGSYPLLEACIASCTQERATAYYTVGHAGSAGAAGTAGFPGLSCATSSSASCSTYCSYEVGSGPTSPRARLRLGCLDELLDFYDCSASGDWSCIERPGYYASQPPLECVRPTNCEGRR